MPIADQDTFFGGQHKSSLPRHLLGEGEVARLYNARFLEGAISNALGFDEYTFNYVTGNDTRVFASRATYGEILTHGDLQLFAPLCNTSGKFLVAVISGILFLLDTETCTAFDITPIDACLAQTSCENQLSYLDNDGGTYGAGGYLVIFNYPNRPIFVNENGARVSSPFAPDYEMPTARLGVTAGNRSFIAYGDNQMVASDPLGGANGLAPLTFEQTYGPSTGFTGQIFTIGSILDVEYITAFCRIPKFLGPSQDFLAQSLLVSTKNKKYIIAAGAPRDSWESIQFISFAGTGEGVAGPHACTNVGDNIMYISTGGRIKTIAQDQEQNTSLSETFIDDPLGQYMCECEPSLYHRDWYRELDHSRSHIKFHKERLYATVYPTYAPNTGKFGQKGYTPTHRALAIGSRDSRTLLGSQARISWEGFYDWLDPIGIAILDEDMYVASKDSCSGRIGFHRLNLTKLDEHKSTIYTRGYFGRSQGRGKSLRSGSLYFRRNPGNIKVSISYLADDVWHCVGTCVPEGNVFKFNVIKDKCRTNSSSIPLKIDIEHEGCRFELESVYVKGEAHKETK